MAKAKTIYTEKVPVTMTEAMFEKIQALAKENNTIPSVYIRHVLEYCADLPLETIKIAARRRRLDPSQFLHRLISQLSLLDETCRTIILKVPIEILINKNKLIEWTVAKVNALKI